MTGKLHCTEADVLVVEPPDTSLVHKAMPGLPDTPATTPGHESESAGAHPPSSVNLSDAPDSVGSEVSDTTSRAAALLTQDTQADQSGVSRNLHDADVERIAPASHPGASARGGLCRIDNAQLIGWIDGDLCESFTLPLLLKTSNGDKARRIRKFVDPRALGIDLPIDGARYFSVDIADMLDLFPLEQIIDVHVSDTSATKQRGATTEGALVFSEVITRHDATPLHANPLLLPTSTVSIDGWSVDCPEHAGLRIDRYSMPSAMRAVNGTASPGGYTRFAFLEGQQSRSSLILRTPLSMHKAGGAVEAVIYAQADRPTRLSCRLYRNDQCLSVFEWMIDFGWGEYRRHLEGSDSKPMLMTCNYRIEIEIAHTGRGFVDVAACAVGRSPSLQTVLDGPAGEPQRVDGTCEELRQAAQNVSFIRNGDFQHWGNGLFFDNVTPRQEIADGWRFECRNRYAKEVRVQLEQVSDGSRRQGDSGSSAFGLRVTTGPFEGPMRCVSVLDRALLDSSDLELTVDLAVAEPLDGAQEIRRIYIVGRGVGREEIVHVIAKKLRVRSREKLGFSIDETQMIQLRKRASEHSSLLIAIEFEQNNDLVIVGLALRPLPTAARNGSSQFGSIDMTRELSFEDVGIGAQAGVLKGLESWTSQSVIEQCHDYAVGRRTSGNFDEIRTFANPTIRRPTRGYPSIDIVVPIYNAIEAVRECLRSVIEETSVPYTLICVNDGSDEETSQWLGECARVWPQVQLVTNPENIGYTKTVNRGIESSTADWVCVLNSDCLVTEGWLEKLTDVCTRHERTGIIGPLSNAASYQSVPRIRNTSGGWSFNPLPAGVSPNDVAKLVWENSLSAHPSVRIANGFCQLMSRKMLDDIGWLDEQSFPRGFGEENDLCARAVAAGYEIRIADDAYVYHVKSQSFGHAERKRLSSIGSEALKLKHPDIEWSEVTRDLEHQPALIELRGRLMKEGF